MPVLFPTLNFSKRCSYYLSKGRNNVLFHKRLSLFPAMIRRGTTIHNNYVIQIVPTWNSLGIFCKGIWIKVHFGVSSSTDQIGDEELESEFLMANFSDLVKYFPSLLNQNRMHLASAAWMRGLKNCLLCSLPPQRYRYFSVKQNKDKTTNTLINFVLKHSSLCSS